MEKKHYLCTYNMKYVEVKLTLSPHSETAADLLSATLSEIGFEAFDETDEGLKAYIQQGVWDEAKLQEAVRNFYLPDVRIDYVFADAPNEDWNQVWEEEGFQPVCIPLEAAEGGGLIVVHDVKHNEVPEATYDILITPRLAFGTGSHATTRLILRALARLDLKGKHVIDAGTGTGVLAIMAAKQGAASVFAYDIDEWSIENTKDNLLLNGLAYRDYRNYRNYRDYSEKGVVLALGDSSVLEGCEGADLLIANINRNILLQDLPRFAKAVAGKGLMILSGFYLADIPALEEAAGQQGFSLKETAHEGEWAMLLFEADALGGRNV